MQKQVFNPFLPLSEYIPDGEPHVFGDRVYLFGSHDKENGETFCMLDYVGWSAPVDDLSDWTCSGVIYSAKQDPLYGVSLKYMYAPDCVQGNDGRYYLYYCMSGDKGVGGYSNPVSVAVCDIPDGHYEYLGVVKDSDGAPLLRYACFDPAVINDNGIIRLYYGTDFPWFDRIPFSGMKEKAIANVVGRTAEQVRTVPGGVTGAYHVTLGEDMLTAADMPRRIDTAISGGEYEKHKFFEGSSMRKVGDIYYFIYSSVNNHELCYAASPHPDRGFQFGGAIVSNGDIGLNGRKAEDRLNHTGTNHGSIECINGQWYVFYHRLTNNSDYSRQACAEKIKIQTDGRILQTEITSCGLNGGALKAEGVYPAVICCNLTNGKMKHGSNQKRKSKEPCVVCRGRERYIKNISRNTLIGYKYFKEGKRTPLTVTVRGKGSGGLEVRLQEKGPACGRIEITPSDTWREMTCVLPELKGVYALYFHYIGKGNIELLNFGWKEPHHAKV